MPKLLSRRRHLSRLGRALALLLPLSLPAAAAGAEGVAAAPAAVQFCRASCGEPYLLQVADTARAHARGLMGVRSLPPRGGMLFIFPRAERRAFWMKDTPLALDLVFVGADCRVVGVVRDATPFDERELGVAQASQYVVELAAGSAAEAGLRPGDAVRFAAEAGRCGPPVTAAPRPPAAPTDGAATLAPGCAEEAGAVPEGGPRPAWRRAPR